jgi:hypothetical protein
MTEIECPGGMAGDRLITPPSGRHEWGKGREHGKQVCSFCSARRDTPPAAKDVRPMSIEGRPLVLGARLPDWPRRPSNEVPEPPGTRGWHGVSHARFLNLREHQDANRLRHYKPFDREEAIKLGYPEEQIVDQWPTP